jgi:pimeloyl-ACP methyl ester carboxylesterase
MNTARSHDGTPIAYETSGEGPPLILVDGALCYRASGPSRPLAAELASHFTVYTYDRRGRGDSGDTAPYSVDREVEDLEALIEEAGGSAHVYGISSGAVLALQAAAQGAAIESLALYEPPFIVDASRAPMPDDYRERVEGLVATGRRGDAVKMFMRHVGVPRALVALMGLMPMFKRLKDVAHTLAYDAAVMGDTQSGRPLPRTRWSGVTAPTLVIAGGKSPAWLHVGAQELADVVPGAESRVLPGQTHMVKAKALAPMLADWFSQRAVQPRSMV